MSRVDELRTTSSSCLARAKSKLLYRRIHFDGSLGNIDSLNCRRNRRKRASHNQRHRQRCSSAADNRIRSDDKLFRHAQRTLHRFRGHQRYRTWLHHGRRILGRPEQLLELVRVRRHRLTAANGHRTTAPPSAWRGLSVPASFNTNHRGRRTPAPANKLVREWIIENRGILRPAKSGRGSRTRTWDPTVMSRML